MLAAGIKIATSVATNTVNTCRAAEQSTLSDEDVKINTRTANTTNEANCVLVVQNRVEESSSFCHLPSLREQQSSSNSEIQKSNVPLENCHINRQPDDEILERLPTVISRDLNDLDNNYVKHEGVELSPGLSLLQQAAAASSPPPHSYRHSKAYRHFKNPPQPHMCIRTTTEAGEELFINVLSWTRIVIPQEPSDPIPLYGGMRVPPGSPRSPPIVFAVMANPEVLKDSGRHSKDPEERRAMVELMCDFVEAMNPGVKLVRNAIILKDRDISGELKDVWNAVQAQRDREREEQMLLQRQQHQQHLHNLTNSSANGSLNINSCAASTTNLVTAVTTQQMFPRSVHSNEAISTSVDGGTPPESKKLMHEVQSNYNTSNIGIEIEKESMDIIKKNNTQDSLSLLGEHLDNKLTLSGDSHNVEVEKQEQHNNQNSLTNDALNNGNNSKLLGESDSRSDRNNQLNTINCNKDLKQQQKQILSNGFRSNCNDAEIINVNATVQQKSTKLSSISNVASSNLAQHNTSATSAISTPQQAPAKKEKLGGFLPNGCIFPRFTKNNKHKEKDKDKDKDKDTKPKDKEKNVLLSALKKSKDKKTNTNNTAAAAAANQDEKNSSSTTTTAAANSNQTQQTFNKQQKNCLQKLECGIQKLDLNNHHQHHSHIT